ncbi:MAG: TIM barrel protein [Bryobacterales bacterium]|nr:TIM barrel protein [Bryobacterales bacterium]
MNRREFLPATAMGAAAAAAADGTQGRIKQSVCRWCYRNVSTEDLAKESARLGIQAIDLLEQKDWAVAKKYGLIPTIVPGPTNIPNGFNRLENHDEIEKKFRDLVVVASQEKIPSIIVFSGNRRGMSDEQGAENCVTGLNRIKKYAEDKGILVVMELLNSKVDHKDYMCDHTAWGVNVIKQVNSPNVKLLYDIYHMQIMEGDCIRTIRENFQYIGHYHTGGNPGRNEIDETQELNYRAISKAIADLGFQGYMAHEFVPKREPLKSLAEAVQLCTV